MLAQLRWIRGVIYSAAGEVTARASAKVEGENAMNRRHPLGAPWHHDHVRSHSPRLDGVLVVWRPSAPLHVYAETRAIELLLPVAGCAADCSDSKLRPPD